MRLLLLLLLPLLLPLPLLLLLLLLWLSLSPLLPLSALASALARHSREGGNRSGLCFCFCI